MNDALNTFSLSLGILGQRVRIDCSSSEVLALLSHNFGAMTTSTEAKRVDLRYSIRYTGPGFVVSRDGQCSLMGVGLDNLLFLMEKDITVELQKRRPELLFLHAAAVEWAGKAYLLAAESGNGKSTTTWALLSHGFGYLSDELSPVDLVSMAVFPYPHALCLKQPPAVPYGLPPRAIDLGRTVHIPVASVSPAQPLAAVPIGAVFIVKYRSELDVPNLRAMGPAEASTRLYVTALNALSHVNYGLDAVVSIAERVPCFAIESTVDLTWACALIRSVVEQATERERGQSSGPSRRRQRMHPA
jgi:hypothetical protein